MSREKQQNERLSLSEAVFILAVIVFIMFMGMIVMRLDPYIPLLVGIGFLLIAGRIKAIAWGDMVDAMMAFLGQNIASVGVILIIGVVIGSFMTCGTVPFIIYYGLKFMSARWFFMFTVLICFAMAMVTGSSFTSASTIGVAFMGVGISLGIPPAMIAGAIVTGALSGDKHSPLSAVENLSASLCDLSVYETERCTRYTTFPTVIISAVVFTLLGSKYAAQSADMSQVNLIMEGLAENYELSPVVVLPLVLMLVLVILKVPAFPTMFLSSMAGVVISVVFQHETLRDCFIYLQSGYVSDTGVELLDRLLSRGGLLSMSSVITVIILGIMLAGCMSRMSIMEIVTARIGDAMKNRFSVITGTFAMSVLLVLISSDTYMAMVLTANSFKKCFERAGIHPAVMSRCLVDGGCGMVGIIPWCPAGIFFAQTLGVPVLEYAPFYFLGLGTLIFTLLWAATGIGVWKAEPAGEKTAVQNA